MMRGHRHWTPELHTGDAKAARIAALSTAWLSAPAEDQERIAEEIAALIDGRVLAFPR